MTALVIGYGNTLRGDDGAGPAVAEAVAALGLPGVRVLAVPQLTPELAELLAEACLALFVDASAEKAGEVEVLPVQPAQGTASLCHTSDPGVLLALAWALYGACPPASIVRVPAVCFQFGATMSPPASRGIAEGVREVVRLLGISGIMRSPLSSPVGNPPAGACR
jgi:hydrogenase maturation protease